MRFVPEHRSAIQRKRVGKAVQRQAQRRFVACLDDLA